jgi:cysteine-rich repeat protein
MRKHYRLSSCLILIVVGLFAAGCGGGAGADDSGGQVPFCGNSVVDAGEDCDGGGETVACDIDCSSVVCGDGTLNISAGERCDDGNTELGDGCDANCKSEFAGAAPLNLFNIGDSIGVAEAAGGTIGSSNRDKVWSTGYGPVDTVYSLNEHFEDIDPAFYNANSASDDAGYNKAESGAVMADFENQADAVASEAADVGGAGMVTVLLGSNDVCRPSLAVMTDPDDFEEQYRAGLDALAASEDTKDADIHVSGIPDIYWLWVAKKDVQGCSTVWQVGAVCQALLENSDIDDCESIASRDDPDGYSPGYYPGDGPNCQRRKFFHRRIQEVYNPILENVLQEYIDADRLPNAYYVDTFDFRFESEHVNNGDCFHPSILGHKLMADEQWCRSPWSTGDPYCAP